MKIKNLAGIVLGAFLHQAVKAQPLDDLGILPDATVEIVTLDDSLSWKNSLNVDDSGNPGYKAKIGLKSSTVKVDAKSELGRIFNREYKPEDLKLCFIDRDEGAGVPPKSPPPCADLKDTEMIELPDYITNGYFAAYLETRSGIIPNIRIGRVARVAEYYRLPKPIEGQRFEISDKVSGTYNLTLSARPEVCPPKGECVLIPGKIPDAEAIAEIFEGEKTYHIMPVTGYRMKGIKIKDLITDKVLLDKMLAGSTSELGLFLPEFRKGYYSIEVVVKDEKNKEETEILDLKANPGLAKPRLIRELEPEPDAGKVNAAVRLNFIEGFTHIPLPRSTIRTEADGLGLATALGFYANRNFGLGAFALFEARGLQVGDIGRRVSLGTGNSLGYLALGPTLILNSGERERGELLARFSPGFLSQRMKYGYDALNFKRETTDVSFMADADLAMPRLVLDNKRVQLGLADHLYAESFGLRVKEKTSGMKTSYGRKSNLTNALLLTLRSSVVRAGAGWQYDSLYNLGLRRDISQEDLERITRESQQDGVLDLTDSTEGNSSGHQIPAYLKLRLRKNLSLAAKVLVNVAGDLQRRGVGFDLSYNGKVRLGYTYEQSDLDGAEENRHLVVLDVGVDLDNSFMPRVRTRYLGR